ncbi:striated muscle preferentially expressed protein kinase isoform X3 [Paramormyrops kingsleyae]|uniref:striated muscle preferentially expressed protein kinase isoform X3 n=1 Tax=Paramormyrops kingsleyae TaxID=1676925 RepID=UPI003B970F4B
MPPTPASTPAWPTTSWVKLAVAPSWPCWTWEKKPGHSSRTFGRFTHVFRSCRKQRYDSETTEDETTEAHIPMEAKGEVGGQAKQAPRRGEGVRSVLAESGPSRGIRTDGWSPGQDTVVEEEEAPALGSRAPGLQDPLRAGRSQSEDTLSEVKTQVHPPPTLSPPQISQRTAAAPLPIRFGMIPARSPSERKKAVTLIPTNYQDIVSGDFEETIKQSQASAASQSGAQDSRPQTPISEGSWKDQTHWPLAKVGRPSSKIFEKVRVFEERRRSTDHTEGSISGRSWAGFNQAASIDSDDGGSRLRISRENSREDLRETLKADAAERRSSFRQRAASLEDRSHYSQKVQEIENKFTQELQRIKNLMGKSHMKKSFSTEQVHQHGRQPLRKLEPIPPQVLQKLQDRERIQWQQEQGEQLTESLVQKSPSSPEGRLHQSQLNPQQESNHRPDTMKSSVISITVSRLGEKSNSSESKPLAELPGQRSSRQIQRSIPVKEASTEMSHTSKDQTPSQPPKEKSPPRKVQPSIPKVDQTQVKSLVQTEPPHVEERPTQPPPKPPRLLRSVSSTTSPMSKEETREAQLIPASLAHRLSIPIIIVEEDPMKEDVLMLKNQVEKAEVTEGWRSWTGMGKVHHAKPLSPDTDSMDVLYESGGEDTMEAPMFESPLQDTVVSAGSEVVLKCIITGIPLPEVTWWKGNTEIKNSPMHSIRMEGNRHSLVIEQLNASHVGSYTVMAANCTGRTSCSAMLFIKSEIETHQTRQHFSSLQLSNFEPAEDQQRVHGVPSDLSSAITSNEERLSPLEEGMEAEGGSCRGPESRRAVDVAFREAPSFQVTLNDQVGTEGDDITMRVCVQGQPKPLIYWLRGRLVIKASNRHTLQEAEDGSFEMQITAAQKTDTGLYTCKIVNEYGMKQCDCHLEVLVPPVDSGLAITREITDVTVKAGETALFECYMSGSPDVDVDWLSDRKLIQPALLNCKMHFDGSTCRLLLNSVHEDDSGTYTCKLSTAKVELTSSAYLKVIPSTEPMFTRKLDVLEVLEGRTARFDCKVSGTPSPNIIWKHFDLTLTDSESVRMLKDKGRHSLLILHASSSDEGLYTAVAYNAHGMAESSAELYVQEPRPTISSQMAKLEKMPSIPEEPEVVESEVERYTMPDFVKSLFDLEVVQGREAVLRCQVAGLPYPSIAWFHNGHKIDSTDDRKMVQHQDVHSLVIRMVCHTHGGVYKSVISNRVGKATCYAHLYVTDILPEPPDGPPVVEAITGKIISLRWNKPKRLHPSIDSSSLMFVVQQQAVGSNQWSIIASSLKQTCYTITSLCKGVKYCFRVLSATSKALSKPSPSTDPLQLVERGPYLPEAPVLIDKPDIVYMVENQPVNMTVTLNHVQATVIWKRNGVQLENKPGEFELSMPDDNQHTLCISRARASDVGQLICVASNPLGNDSCILMLDMAAPPTFESIMEDMDVHIGETSRLVVVVYGKPIPDIMWYKDDMLLSESSHFTFVYDDTECSLVILNTQEEDSGVYTCTAQNLAGSMSCKAELTVLTAAKQETEEPMEGEETILRKMRRLTDYYDIHKEIGRGAFSYVKRVTQKANKAEFAAKFVSVRAKRKTSALREMRLLLRLEHERIIYFHDAFEKKNVIVIVTELCHEELLDRIAKKSSIMECEIRSSIRQLLEGLGYLHQNDILHLDIKPENILMADRSSDQVRICDFGNAIELTPGDTHYCKYGTPEFIAPEVVNQTPVSKATDIWPVGVITYLCLTGVSPFAGENDRDTALNVRNYNVAFEEGMFAGVCWEGRGFIIKLLVADRLRPDTNECLRHPWFKTLTKGKSISTESLKQFLSRRKWQRSLISYKSKMVMRSIPEVLDDSSSHISIAVPRHLKEGTPPPSSSSDSDEDVDELPFIPMPLTVAFSGSRMSLNEISADDEVLGRPTSSALEAVGAEEPMECEPVSRGTGQTRKREAQEGDTMSEEESAQMAKQMRGPLCRGSSVESDKAESSQRRGELRRGSSADSALLLHITPEGGTTVTPKEEGGKSLKKAVSMELPRRSPSPSPGRLSQEDYALKLELMRQRLLRGSSGDNKMSGLRGPLLETLGIGDERRTVSLDRYTHPRRVAVPPLIKAASTEAPGVGAVKTKVLCKSASFTQGDNEPIPLHRRSGAPLEIPLAQREEQRLQEATSMSALTEQARLDSRPVTPREVCSKPPSPVPEAPEQSTVVGKEAKALGDTESRMEDEAADITGETPQVSHPERKSSMLENPEGKQEKVAISKPLSLEREMQAQIRPYSEVAPRVIQESDHVEEKMREEANRKECEGTKKEVRSQKRTPEISISTKSIVVTPGPSKTQVSPATQPSRVTLPDGRTSAYSSIMQTILVPSLQLAEMPALVPAPAPSPIQAPSLNPTISPLKPESSPSLEHPAVFSRVRSRTPTSSIPLQELAFNPSIKDIASEEVFQARFKKRESSLTRGLKMLTKPKTEEKVNVTSAPTGDEEVYRPSPVGVPLEFIRYETPRLVERSMSVQELRPAEKESFMRRLSLRMKRAPSADRKDERNREELANSTVTAPRRRVSWAVGRSRSQEKNEPDGEVECSQDEGGSSTPRRSGESPVLAMRRKIGSTVAGISMRIRSQSEERREERKAEEKEAKPESRRAPLISILRRSGSEGGSQRKVAEPRAGESMESLESTSSLQSAKGLDDERRSRWDRWGLGRSKKEKTDIPSSIVRGNGALQRNQYSCLASDFPPVFHIKLRDHVLLEGDPVTLSCLPAGIPHPRIAWVKDKKPLDVDARMNMIACPDGRQLLMIMKTTKKDAGFYECVATNPLGSVSSSCTVSLARLPNQPGTPEIPQRYRDTVLVLWKPSDTLTPCTYSLERRTEGEENWLIVATGVADCYYNVTDLSAGYTFRFRVACVNKAGQSPYSNVSEKVCLDSSATPKAAASMIMKPSASSVSSAMPLRPASAAIPSKSGFAVSHPTSTPPPSNVSSFSQSHALPTHPGPAQGIVPPAAQAPPTCPASAQRIVPPIAQGPPTHPASAQKIVPPTDKAPTIRSSSHQGSAPPTAQAPPILLVSAHTEVPSPPAHVATPTQFVQEFQAPSSVPSTSTKAKSTLNITMGNPSPGVQPTIRTTPPRVLPKSLSPVNVVPPMTQSPPVSPPPLVSPSPPLGRPISPIPTYVPMSTDQATPPATGPTLLSPVVMVTSLSPFGEAAATPSVQKAPSGKPGESTLRQGVPQKPYTFLEEKSRGRFGVIRECRENATGQLFMAKIVPYESESKQGVLREYEVLKNLHHSNVMVLHEAYITPHYLVLIAESCSGKELLYSLVDRYRYSEDDVVSFVVQALQGLEYLHNRRILHLDIKPDNIMVSPTNVLKIVDFGSAQSFNPLFLKPHNCHLSTLEFMAPETVKGDVVGPPADIWSLGVVTYVMLSGRLPFQESDTLETEAKILAAKFDQTKLYQNVSQSASLFLKKIMCSYAWARPTIKDCFNNAWLQDAYLMKLRRQTLTFTTTRLKAFLVEQQRRRAEGVTKHKVLLRSYQSSTTMPTTSTAQ